MNYRKWFAAILLGSFCLIGVAGCADADKQYAEKVRQLFAGGSADGKTDQEVGDLGRSMCESIKEQSASDARAAREFAKMSADTMVGNGASASDGYDLAQLTVDTYCPEFSDEVSGARQ